MLGRHELRQLAQRVTARYHLSAAQPPGDARTTSATAWRWPAARARSPSPRTRSRAVHRCSRRHPAPHQPRLRPRAAGRLRRGDARDRRGHGAPRRERGPGRAPAPPARGARPRWPRAWPWPRSCPSCSGARCPPLRAGRAGAAAASARRAAARRHRARRPPRRAAVPPPAAPSTPVLLALPHDASMLDAVGAHPGAVGDARPRAHGPAHAHGPGARASTCRWSSRCSIPRARDTCYVALLRIDGDEAVVAIGERAAAARAAGRARPPLDAAGPLPVARLRRAAAAGDPGRTEAWARDASRAWVPAATPTCSPRSRASSATPTSPPTGASARARS